MSDTQWIQTFSGKQFWPLNPQAKDVGIHDIAHALSNLCRYGGHTTSFYSVAQHCVLVSEIVSPELALCGLLHDASEAYLIDVPRPIKHSVGMEAYRKAEQRLEEMIAQVFRVPYPFPPEIKTADNQLLRTEQRDLMAQPPAPWTDYGVNPCEFTIEPWLPKHAANNFLVRYMELAQ